MKRAHQFLHLFSLWAVYVSCQQCSPGCTPLQDAITSSGGSDTTTLLHGPGSGACYRVSSDAHTPSLTLLGGSQNTTWASATQPDLPVVDLCNQVQDIWVMQREWDSLDSHAGRGPTPMNHQGMHAPSSPPRPTQAHAYTAGNDLTNYFPARYNPKPEPHTLADSHLLVQGLLLRNAVLPSGQLVDSGLAAPAPLAFNLSLAGSSSSNSSASLVLDSCTVSTSCGNLAQFVAWLGKQQVPFFTQVGA